MNIGLAIEHWIGYDTVSYFNNIGHWFGPMILVCVIYMQKVSGVLGPGEKRILGMCRGTRSHFHPSGGSGGSSFSTGGGPKKIKSIYGLSIGCEAATARVSRAGGGFF